jgi:hypothetical protein
VNQLGGNGPWELYYLLLRREVQKAHRIALRIKKRVQRILRNPPETKQAPASHRFEFTHEEITPLLRAKTPVIRSAEQRLQESKELLGQ